MSRSDGQEKIKKLVASLQSMEKLIEGAPKPPEGGCPLNLKKYDTNQYAPGNVKALIGPIKVSGGSRNRVQRGGPRNRTQRDRPATEPARGNEDGPDSSESSGDETDLANIVTNVQGVRSDLVEKKRELIEQIKDANLHEKSKEEANKKVETIIASLGFAGDMTEEEVNALQEATEKMVASQKELIEKNKPFVALSLFIHIAGIWALKASGTAEVLLSYVGDSYRSLAGITPLGDSCDLDNFWNIFNWADDCQQVSQYTTIFWLTIISTVGTIAAYKYPDIIPGIDTSNPFKILLTLAKASTLQLAELFKNIESFQTAAANVITWPFERIMAVCRWAGRVDRSGRDSPPDRVNPAASTRPSPSASRRGSPQPSPPPSQQASPQNSGDDSDSDSDSSDDESGDGTSGGRRRKGKRRQTKKRKGRGRKSPTRKRGRKGKGKKKNKAKSKKRKPVKKRSTRKKQRGGGDCPCSAPVANTVPVGGKKKGRGRKSRGKKRSNKRRTYKK